MRSPLYGGCGRDFYPRPPRGGRHSTYEDSAAPYVISIHALREEGDVPVIAPSDRLFNFYPRPPRGGRPGAVKRKGGYVIFLSTPSARRATSRP